MWSQARRTAYRSRARRRRRGRHCHRAAERRASTSAPARPTCALLRARRATHCARHCAAPPTHASATASHAGTPEGLIALATSLDGCRRPPPSPRRSWSAWARHGSSSPSQALARTPACVITHRRGAQDTTCAGRSPHSWNRVRSPSTATGWTFRALDRSSSSAPCFTSAPAHPVPDPAGRASPPSGAPRAATSTADHDAFVLEDDPSATPARTASRSGNNTLNRSHRRHELIFEDGRPRAGVGWLVAPPALSKAIEHEKLRRPRRRCARAAARRPRRARGPRPPHPPLAARLPPPPRPAHRRPRARPARARARTARPPAAVARRPAAHADEGALVAAAGPRARPRRPRPPRRPPPRPALHPRLPPHRRPAIEPGCAPSPRQPRP